MIRARQNGAILAVILLLITVQLSAAELQNLIIHNVRIIKTGGQSTTDLASLRIVNGELDLVSADQILPEEGVQVLDANEGFLLGSLIVGEAPKFIILNKNPVTDLTVLLDTKPYVVFAIDDGRVLQNKLRPELVVAPKPAAEEDKFRWLAYSAPPIALPTTIESSRKWNTWKTKYVNGLFISALALDRQWLNQDDNSISQFGDLSADPDLNDLSQNYGRGTIRGWRFGAAGTINFQDPWTYNIAGAWNSFDRGFDDEDPDEFEFFDFSVSIPAGKNISVSIGKQKEPINMDRSMTMIEIASQERYATADAMFPSRNFGVVVNGTAMNQRISWAGGLFNDWLIEGESLDDSATQVVGRVTWLPIISADESNLFHVGFGVRHTDAKKGLAYGSRPEIGAAPRFVDTGVFDAKSSTLYNWEAGWRSGPYWIIAEYSDNHIDAPGVGNPRLSGYHISGTWVLSGEMRPYSKTSGVFRGVPVAQNVTQGGRGAVELGFRYSSIDLTDGAIMGGEMDVATVQLNWWATRSLAVSLNYKHSWTDRFGIDGEMDAFVARVLMILQ
jgi:phosphate-selective porin OprO/OprP